MRAWCRRKTRRMYNVCSVFKTKWRKYFRKDAITISNAAKAREMTTKTFSHGITTIIFTHTCIHLAILGLYCDCERYIFYLHFPMIYCRSGFNMLIIYPTTSWTVLHFSGLPVEYFVSLNGCLINVVIVGILYWFLALDQRLLDKILVIPLSLMFTVGFFGGRGGAGNQAQALMLAGEALSLN